MLDDVKRELQTLIDDLEDEADRLRRALTILSPDDGPADAIPARRRGRPRRTAASQPRSRRTAVTEAGGSVSSRADKRVATQPSNGRSASGKTKAAVLAALAGSHAMTAGEVARATGLGRPSVSTTLSKLARSGEVRKAARGYELAA